MKILRIATGNAHKLIEIEAILHLPGLEIKGISDCPDLPEAIEDADTFEGNALIKARIVARELGVWALADDSGIEVDALDKAPGIFSARYAGTHGDDKGNNKKLMAEVAQLSNTRARFVAALALVGPDGTERVVRATVEGQVIAEERGATGFGYDPMFIPDGYEKTFAELGDGIKNGFSHRSRALAQIKPVIEELVLGEVG